MSQKYNFVLFLKMIVQLLCDLEPPEVRTKIFFKNFYFKLL
jgi:hypothetical protein